MIIVKGKVWTFNGWVSVENLKIGDLIIDRAGSARKLLGIEKVVVANALNFKSKPNLLLSSDSLIYSNTGSIQVLKDGEYNIRMENNATVNDMITIKSYNGYGYKLSIQDGIDCFVEGYNVQL